MHPFKVTFDVCVLFYRMFAHCVLTMRTASTPLNVVYKKGSGGTLIYFKLKNGGQNSMFLYHSHCRNRLEYTRTSF